MAEVMSKILGSTLRKADANQPILARSRGAERKLEEEKMESKARKAITNEKRRLASKDRVKPEFTGMEYEKKLRKVATRGGKFNLRSGGKEFRSSPEGHIPFGIKGEYRRLIVIVLCSFITTSGSTV